MFVFFQSEISAVRQHFHNMPRKTVEELSALASIRKLALRDKLASAGDDVTTVFFVFRGECTTKATRNLKGRGEDKQRYGPGHVVGWCAITKMVEGATGGGGHAIDMLKEIHFTPCSSRLTFTYGLLGFNVLRLAYCVFHLFLL